MTECWKDIVGFEGLYQASNCGGIKRLSKVVHNNGLRNDEKEYVSKEIILKPCVLTKGYLGVTLTKDGKRYPKKVHRLVAQAFIPNPLNKPQVNHINGDKQDNRVENLEWVNQFENMRHASEHGLLNCTEATKVKYRPVAQCDQFGNVYMIWKSLKDACKYLGIKSSANITKCCQGKIKKAYGYVWKYVEGERQ